MVEKGDTRLIVDTSTDFREQMLLNNIKDFDAILYTHAHADHCHGIDDIRTFNYIKNGHIDIYCREETLEELRRRFYYIFKDAQNNPRLKYPLVNPTIIDLQPFHIGDIKIEAVELDHGGMPTYGFIFDDKIAYCSDVLRLPDATREKLQNLPIWIMDAAVLRPHLTHSHLEQTLEWIVELKPQRTWLTHMSNELDYGTLVRELPEGVAPAYDGLVIEG